MSNDLLTVAVVAWLLGALIALTGRGLPLVRGLLVFGSVAGIVAAIMALPNGTIAVELPTQLAGAPVIFLIAPEPHGFSASACCPRRSPARWRRRSCKAKPAGCSAPP